MGDTNFNPAVAHFKEIACNYGIRSDNYRYVPKRCGCFRVYCCDTQICSVKVCKFSRREINQRHPNWTNHIRDVVSNKCNHVCNHACNHACNHGCKPSHPPACHPNRPNQCSPNGPVDIVCKPTKALTLEHCPVASYRNEGGVYGYKIKLTIENPNSCPVKNFAVRDLILKDGNGIALLSVDVDRGSSTVFPVTANSPQRLLGGGYIIDPRRSHIPANSTVVIIYCIEILTDAFLTSLYSHVETFGEHTERTTSKLALRTDNFQNVNGISTFATAATTPSEVCVKFEEEDIGVNGVYKEATVDGQLLRVTLTNWVAKTDEPGEYIRVTYTLTGNGFISSAESKAGRATHPIVPDHNNISDTYDVPINFKILKRRTLEIQNAFSNLTFCLRACVPPTISLSLDPITVIAGEPVCVTTSVTGIPTPSVSYTLNGLPVTLTEAGKLDTSDLSPGTYTLVATATNDWGTVFADDMFTVTAA